MNSVPSKGVEANFGPGPLWILKLDLGPRVTQGGYVGF